MKICIIGAGPAGVAMAKAVAMEPRNDLEIHVYERNASAGGLWNYTGKEKEKVSCTVPATDQRQARENTVPGIPYVSAMYEHLETNIVKDMMRYKDVQFPPECETFPTRQEVAEYVRKYAATIPENVRFHYNSTVVELEKHGSWQLTYRDTVSNALSTESFDYVILAQGHFDLPYIPEVRGLAEWNAADPASIIHAKYYNDVERFENKTVLVVGNSASGIDIATQLTTYAGRVIISAASPSPVADILIDNAAQIGKVDEYRVADRSVVTVDGETVSARAVCVQAAVLYSGPDADQRRAREEHYSVPVCRVSGAVCGAGDQRPRAAALAGADDAGVCGGGGCQGRRQGFPRAEVPGRRGVLQPHVRAD
ncbi:hypothetical protein KL941_005003 [Ogataea angusta]|nr:hypothetical protein KL941_005003 [Ogataea angusta]